VSAGADQVAPLGFAAPPRARPGRPLVPRAPAWLRSAGFRFALMYALLLAVSACALCAFLWWATAGLLDRQTEAAIRADAQGLSERWMEGGLPALLLTIDDRLAQNVDDDAIYLVVDQNMRRMAGNLPAWPPVVTHQNDPFPLLVSRAGLRSLARVERFDLPGDFHLLVGRDTRVRAQLGDLLTDALLWSLVVVGVMASAGAVVVRSLFRRTLYNVSDTAAAIAAGDFTRRVRLSGRGDEFDQLAETINDMLDRIARLMDGVRAVSNAIAHDLRTPITRARARLEDAALHAQSAGELRGAIDRATDDLDGIVAVFQALLRIAEIEAGSRRSEFAAFDLAPLLDDLNDLFAAAAEERGLSLAMTLPPGQRLGLVGDQYMVQQALANLLDNAIKFSPPGGIVTLAADLHPDRVDLSVRDQGPGIPLDDRDRATERFFRGEAARHTPGAGLGLALVQAVAQLHGGTLSLREASPGLCAVLSLPRNSAPG